MFKINTQKITLTSNMHITITEGKKATHSCDVNLKELTTPIQANADESGNTPKQ